MVGSISYQFVIQLTCYSCRLIQLMLLLLLSVSIFCFKYLPTSWNCSEYSAGSFATANTRTLPSWLQHAAWWIRNVYREYKLIQKHSGTSPCNTQLMGIFWRKGKKWITHFPFPTLNLNFTYSELTTTRGNVSGPAKESGSGHCTNIWAHFTVWWFCSKSKFNKHGPNCH